MSASARARCLLVSDVYNLFHLSLPFHRNLGSSHHAISRHAISSPRTAHVVCFPLIPLYSQVYRT